MTLHHDSLGRYAAALQCVAEDFRLEADQSVERPRELRRFAKLLDHIAASLIVRRPAELTLVRSTSGRLPSPAAAPRSQSSRTGAAW
jgi:hypothetical protein